VKIKAKDFAIAFSLFLFTAAATGCGHSNRSAPIRVDKSKTVLLKFNPDTASVYHYNIVSQVTIIDKNRSLISYSRTISLGMNLKFDREDKGDLGLELTFSRVYLSMKYGDSTEIDDANVGKHPRSAIGRIMVALKDATLFATLSPAGEIKTEAGYPEIVDVALAGVDLDKDEKENVKTWDMVFRRGEIEKDLNHLIRISPDSTVWQGAKWMQQMTVRGELSYSLENILQLESIDKDIAVIHGEGKIDSVETDGDGAPQTNIQASQGATYKVNTRTGMTISAKISTLAKASLQAQGNAEEIQILTNTSITEKK
jgi:hypothetical protein